MKYSITEYLYLLNVDDFFTYTFEQNDGYYQLILNWYEEGWGEMSKVIVNEKNYSAFITLLEREVDRIY